MCFNLISFCKYRKSNKIMNIVIYFEDKINVFRCEVYGFRICLTAQRHEYWFRQTDRSV